MPLTLWNVAPWTSWNAMPPTFFKKKMFCCFVLEFTKVHIHVTWIVHLHLCFSWKMPIFKFCFEKCWAWLGLSFHDKFIGHKFLGTMWIMCHSIMNLWDTSYHIGV
jgi:hypothetical protein